MAPEHGECKVNARYATAGRRPRIRASASANGERLVVRALARTGLALRRLIVPILSELSGAGALPRLWHL